MKTISLTQGTLCLVDDEDYERINAHKWSLSKNGGYFYAVRKVGNRLVMMHREIVGADDGLVVDHKNHDTLDNQRENLRMCSQQQNLQNSRKRKDNTSGFKGVGFHKRTGKWRARIVVGGLQKEIGEFETAIKAAEVYDQQAERYHGEFAVLNFPKGVRR